MADVTQNWGREISRLLVHASNRSRGRAGVMISSCEAGSYDRLVRLMVDVRRIFLDVLRIRVERSVNCSSMPVTEEGQV